jgi:undecaprenyl-diphosphatase
LRVFEFLKSADKDLFLFLNGMNNSVLDFIMYWASNRFIWIPLYALMLVLIIMRFGKKTYLILLLVAGMITVSDQVSSTLIKNSVQRIRPCHDSEIKSKVHLVYGICGGKYGYFSSHASNSWALAIFLILLFRKSTSMNTGTQPRNQKVTKFVFVAMITYAIVVSYSRVYLGIHYPFDVLSGIIFGLILSFIFAHGFFYFTRNKI